jgi:hypothetical protein
MVIGGLNNVFFLIKLFLVRSELKNKITSVHEYHDKGIDTAKLKFFLAGRQYGIWGCGRGGSSMILLVGLSQLTSQH